MDKLNIKGAPWIMILGPKGAGKTRLSATFPQTLCLDTEAPGAASAFPDEYRISFAPTTGMYKEVVDVVSKISKEHKKGDRCIIWKELPISAISIDTFDTLQKFLLSRYLSGSNKIKRPNWIKADEIWAPKMEIQDWGMILNYQAPLIADLKTLPIPVIWVCHTKTVNPLYEGRGENYHCKMKGSRSPDVSGSIEGWIVNLCDYVLNITIGENNTRKVYTLPTIVDDYEITAADRHRLFKNEEQNMSSFDMPVGPDGFPQRKVIQYITDNHVY
jgi:hypothetical protein